MIPKSIKNNDVSSKLKNAFLTVNKKIYKNQHVEGLHGEIERQYSKIIDNKLQRMERLLSKDVFDEERLVKYIFNGDKEDEDTTQRSSSLHKMEPNEKMNQKIDDDIRKLDKLSMLNIGARYELLNVNKMMVDLDLGFVNLFFIIIRRCTNIKI